MRFRTVASILESKYKINYSQKILTIGSCFAQNIGDNLSKRLFNIKVNPFGISYNNISIGKLIHYCINEKIIVIDELGYNQSSNLFFHYDFHSSFSNSDSHQVVDLINSTINDTKHFLTNIDLVIITMGTSLAYKQNEDIVANCQKMPSKIFNKVLIPIEEQVDALSNTVNALKGLNPDVRILLTVSPIRHIKEGLEQNSLSKSMLRVVCHEMSSKYDNIGYFPSYEIMMDDLRGYRFYGSDLIHPNDMALTYIWEHFKSTFFDEKTNQISVEVDKLNKLLCHNVLNDNKSEIDAHRYKISILKEQLRENYPILTGRL